jgi:hypothetical protein
MIDIPRETTKSDIELIFQICDRFIESLARSNVSSKDISLTAGAQHARLRF